MIRDAMVLLFVLWLPVSLAGSDPLIENEMRRLTRCPEVFETSPPPVNVRVRWSAPQSPHATEDADGLIRIEFLVLYDQSDFFESAEAAGRATQFHPMMELRQRNFYVREDGRLRLRYRESLIGEKWERQKKDVSKFACWQQISS